MKHPEAIWLRLNDKAQMPDEFWTIFGVDRNKLKREYAAAHLARTLSGAYVMKNNKLPYPLNILRFCPDTVMLDPIPIQHPIQDIGEFWEDDSPDVIFSLSAEKSWSYKFIFLYTPPRQEVDTARDRWLDQHWVIHWLVTRCQIGL